MTLETKHYTDGSNATGIGPLPDLSPAQQDRVEAWDRWYADLPRDLTKRLSLHDFKRLGDCFKQAFQINE
jgi:hypothetical protein